MPSGTESGWASQDPATGETRDLRETVLAAALPNVAFDGWTDETLAQAAVEAGLERRMARVAFPRGGLDAAMFHHRRGDHALTERLRGVGLADMRIRDRVIYAVRLRLEIAGEHREAVRRAATLFALPLNSLEGGRLVWETADTIWTALGDPSEDLNWYTKRAILANVYGATTLYWLGDESAHFENTWGFLGRRIDDVMRFEKLKSTVNKNPVGRVLMTGPNWIAARIRKPRTGPVDTGAPVDLPG